MNSPEIIDIQVDDVAISSKPHLMDLLLDAICVVNEEGVFLSIDGACEQIFGYMEHELVGRQMLELVYEPERQRTIQAVGRLMGGHLQYDFQNRYVRKDGSLVHIMWSARWYADRGIRVAVAREITKDRDEENTITTTLPPSTSKCWLLSGAPPSLTPPGHQPIALSTQDYLVLQVLASGEGVVSRKRIIAALGQDYFDYDQRRMDSQMRRLRRKVEQSCGLQLPVTTLRGVGYRFYDPVEVLL
ncbi:PAS domain S-box protein [Allopusillimonas ginsengisoli]|nr:PAS domain S-box protein [Allopusillimonas ginsengisoli]